MESNIMQTRVFIALLVFITVVSLSLVQNYHAENFLPFKTVLGYIVSYVVTGFVKTYMDKRGLSLPKIKKKKAKDKTTK
jgi:hypothetical protein